MQTPATLTHSTIQGAKGPCTAYSGIAAAIKTRGGVEVVLLCSAPEHLVELIKRINPGQSIDSKGFYAVTLIGTQHIITAPTETEDDEL